MSPHAQACPKCGCPNEAYTPRRGITQTHKVPCAKCGALILTQTVKATGGLCRKCAPVRKNSTASIVFACVAIAVIVLWIATTETGGSQKQQHPRVPTKSEWISQVPNARHTQLTRQIICSRAALFQAVGSPYRTSTVGNSMSLHWRCSDGEIQVVCQKLAYTAGGQVVGDVNDY